MGQAVQKRSRRNDDGAAGDSASVHEMYPAYAPVLDHESGHFGLLDMEVRFALENLFHPNPVLLFVALSSRRPDGWAAAGIEQSKLDTDGVRDLTHDPAQRIDLPHQVALRDPPHGRIAVNLGDEVRDHGDHRRPHPEAGASARRFAAGVPSTNNYDVVCNRAAHFQTIDNIVVCEDSGNWRRGPRTRPCLETA